MFSSMGKMIFFVSTKDFVYRFELFSLDEVHDKKQIVVNIIINRFRILDFFKSFPSSLYRDDVFNHHF